jgi:DNA polymerase-3 subunit epsilon
MSVLEDFTDVEVFIIDTETTGLDGSPRDKVVDIAICKATLNKGKVETVYSSLVGHDTSLWDDEQKNAWIFGNSDLTLEMVDTAPPENDVVNEVTKILKGNNVTSFNYAYDFDKFLYREPWNLRSKIIPFRCIMLASKNVCKLPGLYEEYKWPKLEEAYSIIVKDDPAGIHGVQKHRALSDALMASYILLKLYGNGDY